MGYDLTTIKRYLDRAEEWYSAHEDHVFKLMSETDIWVEPSLEDLVHPELWKSIHWNWYISVARERHNR